MKTRNFVTLALTLLVVGSSMSSMLTSDADAARRYRRNYSRSYDRGTDSRWNNRATEVVPAGATLVVRLDQKISSDDANRGDTWTGTIAQSVYSDNRVVIPEGSPVSGVVTSAREGTHSTRAMIALGVRRVTIDGRAYALNADTEPIIADTQSAKKVGAIIGGTAVGALLGHAVGGKKGAVIGGVAGGAGTYGLTRHAFRSMQLKPGTEIAFTTREALVAQL
jgi:hypothetical protein